MSTGPADDVYGGHGGSGQEEADMAGTFRVLSEGFPYWYQACVWITRW